MTPFSSFWQAGYEGADHINPQGEALSMNEATGHLNRVREDYAALIPFNIRTVRETVGWRLVEKDGEFDFSSLEERARVAQELGIQICWTFCHYGYPEDVAFFSPEFITRFARFCDAVTRYLAPFSDIPIYSPINEISFTSWGMENGIFPPPPGVEAGIGDAAKRQMVRATLAGCDAIWAADPRARILQCDPIIHLVPPEVDPELWEGAVAGLREAQYAAWDMICGRLAPELGGSPRYLDLIGANYYHSNQWEGGTEARLWWHLGDKRRKPLYQMLLELHQRYGRPVLLAETSHVGSGRGTWINDITAEVAQAQMIGVDVRGICLYPIIDRPDWDNVAHWHRSGLWDLDYLGPDPHARVLVPHYATALRRAQGMLHRLHSKLCFTNSPPGQESSMSTIVVFCHLRWDFVYQRPQQLLSRLAQFHRILFIEEPVFDEGAPYLETSTPAPNITVYRPHTPVHAPGFHDDQIAVLQPLLENLIKDGSEPIAWFYTPMALPLLNSLTPSLVVYDCMDELAAFKNAPKQLLQRESALLARADLLFTGGPSLHAAKQGRHDNSYCFPSSVDAVHFEQARDRNNGHPDQQHLPHPRLGFYGVLDERLDLDLIAAMADRHPEWQLCMVGPVVKIDPASLPQRPNIHYYGQQTYQALPHFLADWDVCLLPFALNESTRFISPTKVLEYMAAELPIVSTAIKDVVEPHGDVVAIGYDTEGFIAACERALALTDAEKAESGEQMRGRIAATSWDATAEQMATLMDESLLHKRHPVHQDIAPVSRTEMDASNVSVLSTTSPNDAVRIPCLIAGAGPTGLSAAYHYGPGALLLERHDSVGGWCRSIEDNGFTFDFAGHIMFSNDPYVLELYEMLLGDNLHWQNREAWVYSKNVYTRYPFQGALYGLPPEVIKECIVGAIEARYGAAEQPAGAVVKPLDDCCADGSAPDENTTVVDGAGCEPKNFEEFIHKVWGKGIGKHFAIPYNKKLWTVPLSEMETSWLGGRVPLPDLEQIIEGALEPVGAPMGPNARFGYPLRGGFQALMEGFLPHIDGQLETGAKIIQVQPREHILTLADGRRYRYDHLISTLPLPELIRMMGDAAPAEIREAAEGLQHISVKCVNLGIGRENLTDKHWIYYPEETIFHRIFVQGNASPHCNPPGGFGITCEITYSPHKPLPVDGQALIDRCIEECIQVGMFTKEDKVLAANIVDMPYAYVIYDHTRAKHVSTVRSWLAKHDIVLSGRYSEWEYYNSDHAFVAGKNAAQKVKALQRKDGTGS
ncbi:FAD-dependent oxidoreductase [Nissabacter sp. SGAir0207]|uniref:FAD-dependent oxidoreductase n=1 Tax=Nissabacter sp. SGAir0207 TaxID=2126321 RepID=UPI0010CCDD45|nr:FAD-dependent oxidoreductase [Nissabacter sp. SGAir0207]QCR38548.1 amine oxidase [Nissabacter sp. SGAir0207]